MSYKSILLALFLSCGWSVSTAQTIESLTERFNSILNSRIHDSLVVNFSELEKMESDAEYNREPLNIRGAYTGYQCADIYKYSVSLSASLNGFSSNILMFAMGMAYSEDSATLKKIDQPYGELMTATQKAIENLEVLKSISKIYDMQDDEMSSFHFEKLKEGFNDLNANLKAMENSLKAVTEIMDK